MITSATAAPAPAEAATSLQKQAYDSVKTRIMNRQLKPGQYITDMQIADELAISRTPVRDALRILEHEGFLVSEARRGWKIYTLTLEDIREIFDLKVVLDSMVVRRAAECRDEAKRVALREALRQMRQATTENDYRGWFEADMLVHRTILSMCANERATRIVNNINEQWQRVRIGLVALEGRMQRSVVEHETFVGAILDGNADEAERQMRVHVNNVREELVHVLTNMVLPFVESGV